MIRIGPDIRTDRKFIITGRNRVVSAIFVRGAFRLNLNVTVGTIHGGFAWDSTGKQQLSYTVANTSHVIKAYVPLCNRPAFSVIRHCKRRKDSYNENNYHHLDQGESVSPGTVLQLFILQH